MEPETDPSKVLVMVTVPSLILVIVIAPVIVTVPPKVKPTVPSTFWLLVVNVTAPVLKLTVPELLLIKPFRNSMAELLALVQLPPELIVTAPMYVFAPVFELASVPEIEVVPVTEKVKLAPVVNKALAATVKLPATVAFALLVAPLA